MVKFPLRTILLLLLISSGAFSQELGADLHVHRHKLANGMTILIVPRPGAPVFYSQSLFRVGSANEIGGTIGSAHLLEHLMFKGTSSIGTRDWKREKELLEFEDSLHRHLEDLERQNSVNQFRRDRLGVDAEDLTARIESVRGSISGVQAELAELVIPNESEEIYSRNGAYGFNAFTGYDVTGYIVAFPKNRMELFMKLESDRLKAPVFREFYTERDVVAEERRLSVETQAGSKLFEQLIATAFVAHPYQIYWEWLSEIGELTREEIYDFFHTFYSPSNSVLVLAGDIDVDETVALAEKYFADWTSSTVPRKIEIDEPAQLGEKRVVVKFDAEPALNIAYHKTAFDHPDNAVFSVINRILSEGRTSRFYKNLVEGKRIALSASAFEFPGEGLGALDPNLFIIDAAPKAPATTADLEAAIYEELEILKTVPVDTLELQKIKNNMLSDFIWSLYDGFGLVGTLAEAELIARDYNYIGYVQRQIGKITPEDIMRVAKEYFTEDNRTVATLETIAEEL